MWGAVRLYSFGGCRRIVRLSKHLRNFSKRRGRGEVVKKGGRGEEEQTAGKEGEKREMR